MKANQNFKLLCFLSALSILFLIYGYIDKWHFYYPYYLGLITLLANFISFIWIKKYSKYIMGLTLLFGTFGIINFFPFEMGMVVFGITIHIIQFIFLLVFSYLNRHKLLDFLSSSNNEIEDDKLETINRKKNIYKNEFLNLSDSELKNKLNQPLTSEAKEVINEILKNRKTAQ